MRAIPMARVLVLYGSSEGQTATIAERIGDVLDAAGHETTLLHANHLPPEFALANYDAVVVGASIHVGRHQSYVTEFVRANADELNELPSAFFSVSLTAAEGTEESEATVATLIEEFLAATEWEPELSLAVAGALTYSKYGFLKRLVMKRIARKSGGETDTSRDYEYTDWDEVEAFAAEFATMLP